jgi:DNA repair exonuclease SbcCD nuclease subunit
MTINYLQDDTTKERIVVVGDIHINCQKYPAYEEKRLLHLAKRLLIVSENNNNKTLVLAGDSFDKATPSLRDIQLFYTFIGLLEKHFNIYVFAGNHDYNTFSFLPASGFVHIKEPAVINKLVMLVPWTHLRTLEESLETGSSYKDLVLVSHARCDIPPYIKEEISIKLLSENFKRVILGDIHTAPKLPFSNVHYTTSPSNIHFTKFVRKAHGFLDYKMAEDEIIFIPLVTYTKELLVCETVEEVVGLLGRTPKENRLVKIKFSGTLEELRAIREVKNPGFILDLSMKIDEISISEEKDSKLSAFLASNKSLTEYAFQYFRDTLNVPEGHLSILKQDYEKLRTLKGAHR